MATIKEFREAIAAAVNDLAGVRGSATIEAQINAPVAQVYLKRVAYDEAMHGPSEAGPATYFFGIRVYASMVSPRAAQDMLDELAEPTGANCLKTIVEADGALADLCDYVLVHDDGDLETVPNTVGVIDYLTKGWTVEVAV